MMDPLTHTASAMDMRLGEDIDTEPLLDPSNLGPSAVVRDRSAAEDAIRVSALQTIGAGSHPPRAGTIGGEAPAADAARADAARILEVGSKFGPDDYAARLDAYAQALTQGSAEYDKALLTEILAKDPGAFSSWLQPSEVNAAAASGTITQGERTAIAQAFVGAYNDGSIPSHENVDSGVVMYGFNPVGSYHANPVEEARATSEFLKFIDSAGSTPETREFRQSFAQYLTDSYALNDKLPVYEIYGQAFQNHAASVAALLVSGDPQSPELAPSFLTSLGDNKLDAFLQRVEAGSVVLTAGYLGRQMQAVDPLGKVADIAQPDALSRLVTTVGNAKGVSADRVAVTLARAPADHDGWFTRDGERTDAWTHLLNGHSQAILKDLTNPDGLPVYADGHIEPAFKDGVHDLGAYLRLINSSGDLAKIEQARGHIADYAGTLRDNIEGAARPEDSIPNGRSLGFLGAAVTDSVSQTFTEYAQTQEQKKAWVEFALDLVASALPGGELAKGTLGDWFKSKVGSEVIQLSFEGFSGEVVDSASGKLTDAAKAHILSQLDEGNVALLVGKLQESNEFIRDLLLADLPAPAYARNESGRENTMQNVNDAYELALGWLNPPPN